MALDLSCGQEEFDLKEIAFQQVFQNLRTSLTEVDLVYPSNFVLRTSSFRSDKDLVKETNQLKI